MTKRIKQTKGPASPVERSASVSQYAGFDLPPSPAGTERFLAANVQLDADQIVHVTVTRYLDTNDAPEVVINMRPDHFRVFCAAITWCEAQLPAMAAAQVALVATEAPR